MLGGNVVQTKKSKGIMMRAITQLLFLILSSLLLISCSSNLESQIIGKWKEIDGTETIEFFKDGTVSVVDEDMPMGGDYKFVDDGHLRIELGGLGALVGPMVFTVSISKNELSLTDANGKVSKYRRVE